MFGSLSLPAFLLAFVVAATAVWVAGVGLWTATAVPSSRLDLGQAGPGSCGGDW